MDINSASQYSMGPKLHSEMGIHFSRCKELDGRLAVFLFLLALECRRCICVGVLSHQLSIYPCLLSPDGALAVVFSASTTKPTSELIVFSYSE